MSTLSSDSEELLGKVHDALGQCDVQRRRADGLEVTVEVWRRKYEEATSGQAALTSHGDQLMRQQVASREAQLAEAHQDNERLRLALQDAERRVKFTETDLLEARQVCGRQAREICDLERRVKSLEADTCEHKPFCERCYLDANEEQPKVEADSHALSPKPTTIREVFQEYDRRTAALSDDQLAAKVREIDVRDAALPCPRAECMKGLRHAGACADAMGRELDSHLPERKPCGGCDVLGCLECSPP